MRDIRAALREKLARALDEFVAQEMRDGFAAHRQMLLDQAASIERLTQLVAGAESRTAAAEERIAQSLHAWERRTRRDLYTAEDQQATRTSAAFLRREMGTAVAHFGKQDTLLAAVKAAPPEGMALEFGVATGSTLRLIAEHVPAGTAFGFDSFEGLPEHWRSGFPAGAFAMDALPEVPGAELVVGWFDESLPRFLAEHPGPVSFLHVDADLYSSTVTVLTELESRLQVGTVVLFDEYFNYPGWEQHEHRAWTEFVDRTGTTFSYLGFTADDEQVAVRITGVPERTA